MAGTSIGAASLKVVASTNGLSSGLDKAYNTLGSFKSKVTKSFSSLGGGALLGGGIGAALVGGTKLFGDAVSTIKELADVGKQAKGLGIASDQFMGLSAAAAKAGVEGEQFTGMLAKLGKKTTDAAAGNKQAADMFARLGLNAAELSKLPLDQQLLKVSTALAALPPGGQQAAAAMGIFEEAGAKLLPVLAQGGAKLQEFIDKQRKMGTALDPKQMEKVLAAKDALPKAEAAFKGLWNRVVVSMAPMITKIAGVFSKILEKAQPVFDWLARAAEAYFGVYADVFGEILDAIGEVITAVGEWVSEMTGFTGEFPTIGEVITGVFKSIGIVGAFVWDGMVMGVGTVAVVVGELLTLFSKIPELLAEVGRAMPDELRPEWFNDLIASGDQFAAWSKRNGEKMSEWGQGTFKNFGKSAEQVETWFAKRGKKDSDEMSKALAAAAAPSAAVKWEYKPTAAVERGSKEDYSARLKWQQGNASAQDKQLAEQRNGNGLLRQVNAGIEKLNNKPAAALGVI
jgi:hypothetical protein